MDRTGLEFYCKVAISSGLQGNKHLRERHVYAGAPRRILSVVGVIVRRERRWTSAGANFRAGTGCGNRKQN
jgi:hypothetical protein